MTNPIEAYAVNPRPIMVQTPARCGQCQQVFDSPTTGMTLNRCGLCGGTVAALVPAPAVDAGVVGYDALCNVMDKAGLFLKWFNIDDSPCDGFRFRQQYLALRTAVEAAALALAAAPGKQTQTVEPAASEKLR